MVNFLDLTVKSDPQKPLHLNIASSPKPKTHEIPETPAEVRQKILFNEHGFTMEESAPEDHKFYNESHSDTDTKFISAVRKDHKILNSSLPMDIFVKTYEDRLVFMPYKYFCMVHYGNVLFCLWCRISSL